MSRLFFLFLLLIVAIPEAVMACSLDRKVVEDGETGESNRYYIGLVKVKYVQYNEDGSFKEAGLQPFMKYKAKKGIDLSQPIIIKYGDKEQPCDFYRPYIGKIMDLNIIEEDGAHFITHFIYGDLFNLTDFEYVGAD